MNPDLEIQLLAVVVAVSLRPSRGLPGAEAGRAHERRDLALDPSRDRARLLLGGGHHLPLLMFGAAATGVLTVALVEALHGRAGQGGRRDRPRLPGALLDRRHPHRPLRGRCPSGSGRRPPGEIAFAPFGGFVGGGWIGPKGLWLMGGSWGPNLLAVASSTRSSSSRPSTPGLAAALGFSPHSSTTDS
jgi:hypothetical protein